MSDTYNFAHGIQRNAAKTLADSLGIPTTGTLRMQNGKYRKTPRPLNDIRASILERVLGRSQGKVKQSSAKELDEYLTLCVLSYHGAFGQALSTVQRYIKTAYDLKHEGNELHAKSQGKSTKVRLRVMEEVESLFAQAEQYLSAARELQTAIEDNPAAAELAVRAAMRNAYAAHEKRLAATSELINI